MEHALRHLAPNDRVKIMLRFFFFIANLRIKGIASVLVGCGGQQLVTMYCCDGWINSFRKYIPKVLLQVCQRSRHGASHPNFHPLSTQPLSVLTSLLQFL